MLKYIILILLSVLFFCGCSQPPHITRYQPTIDPEHMTTSYKGSEPFVTYENEDYKITAALFQYQNFVIASLHLENKTDEDISGDEYTINLFDGRDNKQIKMILRKDIIAFKGRVEAPTSLGVPDPAIEAALSTVVNLVQPKSKSQLVHGLNTIIDHYFAFRPLYAGETREGFLSFLVDFKLEYPLNLVIDIMGDEIIIPYHPILDQ